MSATAGRSTTNTSRPLVCLVAAAVGAVFLLTGILGFVPGITTNLYEGLELAGNDGNAMLLGLFQVSVLHNIVHGLYGVGLVMARTAAGARTYLIGGGIIYLGLWIYGLVIDTAKETNSANFIPLNDADNWLHLGLGAGMIALGLVTSRTHARS
ncbi:MAG: DUF4383 domain-containing protein [Nocardioidaceae bacterium]|nr:DUF4383 domain-containing protein [Nocardioidaceae bacterium]